MPQSGDDEVIRQAKRTASNSQTARAVLLGGSSFSSGFQLLPVGILRRGNLAVTAGAEVGDDISHVEGVPSRSVVFHHSFKFHALSRFHMLDG